MSSFLTAHQHIKGYSVPYNIYGHTSKMASGVWGTAPHCRNIIAHVHVCRRCRHGTTANVPTGLYNLYLPGLPPTFQRPFKQMSAHPAKAQGTSVTEEIWQVIEDQSDEHAVLQTHHYVDIAVNELFAGNFTRLSSASINRS